jgi:hypothetical protein
VSAVPRSRRSRLVLLLLGVALNVAALELTARWWLHDQSRLGMVFTRYADSWWRLGWVNRHERLGVATNAIDSIHQTRGWTLTPNLRDVGPDDARISSNSRGVRGTREHAIPKPPGTTRVLVFGDSFAFGEEVGDDDTFAVGIERRLPGTEVVNLGVHGYAHDQMLLRLREDAAAYEPDVVLLAYASWDDERNPLAFRDYAKPHFELVDGRLELRGVPVPSPQQILDAEPYHSQLVDLLSIVYRRLRWRHGTLQPETRSLADALLLEFVRSARDLGARVVIVYLPTNEEVAGAPAAREGEIRALAMRAGSAFLSLGERFRQSLRDHRRTTQFHWDPVENDVAADEIAGFLRRDGLVAPTSAAGVSTPSPAP